MKLKNFRVSETGNPVFDAEFGQDEHNYLLMIALGVLLEAGIANMRILTATGSMLEQVETAAENDPQAVFDFDVDLTKLQTQGNA